MENWKVAPSSFMCTMQTCLHLKNTNHFRVMLKAHAVGLKCAYVELLQKCLYQAWRESRNFFLFFAPYPEFLMGILHHWRSAFPWEKCNHLISFFFLCILRNWWFDPMGSLYLFSYICSFQEDSVLPRKKGRGSIWLGLLYCWLFLPLQRRCGFSNLILSWGEGGKNQRNMGVGFGLGLLGGIGHRECELGGSNFGTGYNKLIYS